VPSMQRELITVFRCYEAPGVSAFHRISSNLLRVVGLGLLVLSLWIIGTIIESIVWFVVTCQCHVLHTTRLSGICGHRMRNVHMNSLDMR